MKWNTRVENAHTTIVLAAAVCIAVMMLTVGLATSATARAAPTVSLTAASSVAVANARFSQNWARSHTIVVQPNGHDDTTDIQRAFNACVSYGPGCTVALVKGTYHTAQIAVAGFQGSFVGAGQGVTVVQALPNLPLPSTTPFWAAMPGSNNPWPALLAFVGGTTAISQMTIVEPYTNPTQGNWTEPPAPNVLGGNYTALWGGVVITGNAASADVDHVSVFGATGDASGFNMLFGIGYTGVLLPKAWTNPYSNRIPLTGAFTVTGSLFERSLYAVSIENLVNASTDVCYNTATQVATSVFMSDMSNSALLVCKNHGVGSDDDAGVVALQAATRTDLLPSTVYVIDNTLVGSDEADALAFADLGPTYSPAVPSTLSVVAIGNVLDLNTSCGCYPTGNPGSPVVWSYLLKSLVLSSNKIYGGLVEPGLYDLGGPATVSGNTILGSNVGVWIDYANNATVIGNLIKNSAEYGIAVTDGSSYNVVAWNVVKNSGVDDLYWDGTGTGNVWFGNVFGTSSPPGL
jgi:parallel beta-helix repeat protein